MCREGFVVPAGASPGSLKAVPAGYPFPLGVCKERQIKLTRWQLENAAALTYFDSHGGCILAVALRGTPLEGALTCRLSPANLTQLSCISS